MLSTRDAKLVKRYYLLPKAAWYSLVSLFLTGGLAILLVMIDNIGLGSKGFGDLQLIAMAAFMIAEGAVCIACGVVARRGLGSAHWQELEREAIGGNANIGTNPAVAGGIGVAAAGRLVDTLDNDDLDALSAGLEIAGAAMSAYGFFDTMRRMSRAAAAVARAHGMELPGLGRTRLLVIGLPLLLLTLSFAPRFIDSTAQSSASQEVSADTIQAFNAALEPVCSYTLADDPLEHRQDSGYRVSGNITDEDGDIVASVSVETDERGAVDSVVYNADVDIARTPEENLAFAEECFARFYDGNFQRGYRSGGNRAVGHGTRQRARAARGIPPGLPRRRLLYRHRHGPRRHRHPARLGPLRHGTGRGIRRVHLTANLRLPDYVQSLDALFFDPLSLTIFHCHLPAVLHNLFINREK